MATINSDVVRFSPSGLCDSLDETNTAPGGMAILQNLIPDPTTKNLWACRPAATPLTAGPILPADFNADFNTDFNSLSGGAGPIVVIKAIGNLLYGMRNSITYSGYDEPFIFNLLTNTFVLVNNITSSNLPATQASSGDWAPPTIDTVGVNVIVTHPGFTGSNYIGWFNVSNPNNIFWNAGNLAAPGAVQSLGTITGGSGYTNGTYPLVTFTCASALTLGTLVGGSGYIAGFYYNVPLTGGSGSGAQATVQVAGGAVTVVTITRGGVGYAVNDTLSASNTNLGGTGAGFSIKVATISAGTGMTGYVTVALGAVSSIVILNSGSGYNTTDVVTTAAANIGGTGSGFSAAIALTYYGLITFTSPPSWVSQFAQRAYFGVNPTVGQPSVVFTDVLFLNCSNANQALTFGDSLKLTAAHGLPLNNQNGGVIQSLLVFKSTNNIYQITGDYIGSTLSVNTLNAATGTLSPWSIVDTPRGVAFLAPDGYRVVDFFARISDPIGVAGEGVVYPFLNNLYPSRVASSCNANVMRVNVQPSNVVGTPYQEYWYDISRNLWSGPHTFPAQAITAYNNEFIIVPRAVPAQLFASAVVPNPTTSSIENGAQMQFVFQTAMMADPGALSMMNVADLTVNMALVTGQAQINMALIDQDGSVYNSVSYQVTGAPSKWGAMTWGSPTVWRGASNSLRPRRAAFTAPVVYRRIAVYVSGPCAQGFQIGDIFLRRQILDYTQATL